MKGTEKEQYTIYDFDSPELREKFLHPHPRNRWKDLWDIYRDMFQDKRILFAHIIYAVFGALAMVLPIFIVSSLTDILAEGENSIQKAILVAGVYCLVIVICNVIANQVRERNRAKFMTTRIGYTLRSLSKCIYMNLGYFENSAMMGELDNASEVTQSTEEGIEGIFHRFIELGMYVVSGLILTFFITQISLTIPLLALVSVALRVWLQSRVTTYKNENRAPLNDALMKNRRIIDTGIDAQYGKDVRMFHMEPKYHRSFSTQIKRMVQLYRKYFKKEMQYAPVKAIVSVLPTVMGLYFLGRQYVVSAVEAGQLVTLLTALLLFGHVVDLIAETICFAYDQTQMLGNMLDFQEAEFTVRRKGVHFQPQTPVHVVFENVSFRYPGSNRNVFDDLSFEIKPGEKLALVGVNGAGKTTIAKLMTGLYLPIKGSVKIDGVDTRDIDESDIYRTVGAVFQETSIPAFTILEYVSASENGDRMRAEASLRAAGIWEKIASLPLGIDSPITKYIEEDGVIFSGGENQKICIARALYKENTQLLIMDEPTASLDAIAEEKICQELNGIMSGKTSLFISHRLASTRFCDRIILLDGGRIDEMGTHAQLMNADGLYRKMFITQGKYYQGNTAEGIAASS